MSSSTTSSPSSPSSSSSSPSVVAKKTWLATLRDPIGGWKNFAALFYALSADLLGVLWMMEYSSRYMAGKNSTLVYDLLSHLTSFLKLLVAILSAAHGRIVASYLVHDAAHGSIFVESPPWRGLANAVFGTVALILAGCPYVDFYHLRKMHMFHHKDRADVIEFDYRQLVRQLPTSARQLIYGLEYVHVPGIETMMHLRAAFYPIVCFGMKTPYTCTPSRHRAAWIGTMMQLAFYAFLWQHGTLLPHIVAGAFVLQFLALSDAFHHTYEAIPLTDSYKSGPAGRTAVFEEENTYSNVLLSTQPAWINLLALNFGYHNAHHQKPLVPWYALPELHQQLYGGTSNDSGNTLIMPQVLPLAECLRAWNRHKIARITDDHYGVVHPPGTPGRADNFVGALGVSFLTV